jgi:transposase InsO family protein
MKYPSVYLKMQVLGALEYAEGRSYREKYRKVAAMVFRDEDGHPRKFTWKTIYTWHWRYRKLGIAALEYSPRKDKGKTRKMSPQMLLEAIETALPFFHRRQYNKRDIYRFCVEKNLIQPEHCAQTTFYRWIREYDLFNNESITNNRKRLAFSMAYANQLWQADTLFGPMIRVQGKPVQSKLIAFIDDCSRVVCHGEFFFQENVETLIKAFRSALYKRGIPEQLYVDNGSIYSSREITLICARLGILLRHTPVHDGASKGKIERFFRTVRDQFLGRVVDLSSLEVLNRQFITWLEEQYNNRVHSTLQMKPIDRFGMDLKRIRFLNPSENNDALFYVEENRKVKKDNTFSVFNRRFEAPRDLRNKTIQIRFDRHQKNKVLVYFKDQPMGEAKPVDLIANAFLKRQ